MLKIRRKHMIFFLIKHLVAFALSFMWSYWAADYHIHLMSHFGVAFRYIIIIVPLWMIEYHKGYDICMRYMRKENR